MLKYKGGLSNAGDFKSVFGTVFDCSCWIETRLESVWSSLLIKKKIKAGFVEQKSSFVVRLLHERLVFSALCISSPYIYRVS